MVLVLIYYKFEDLKFDIQYKQYPILNPNLTNTYSIYNQENDYTGSMVTKQQERV